MFDFGAFAGGLADGVERGERIVRSVQEQQKRKRMRDFLNQSRAELGAQYDAKYGGEPSAGQPSAPAQPPQGPTQPTAEIQPNNGPQGEMPTVDLTKSQDEIRARESAKLPPSVSNQSAAPSETRDVTPTITNPAAVKRPSMSRSQYISEQMGLRGYEFFVSEGDIETAEKWKRHYETAKGQRAVRDWAAAYTAPDFDGALRGFGKYYTDHVNDGVDYKGHEIITKEDGTQVGIVTLRDRKSGNETKMELTRDRMIQLGEAWNPAALFKSESARAEAARAARASAAEKDLAHSRAMEIADAKENRADRRERFKADREEAQIRLRGDIERSNATAKAKDEARAKVALLEQYGYTAEEIKPMIPTLLKGGEYKKATSPEERRAMVTSDLIKSDPTFARLPPEKQRERVDQIMQVMSASSSAAPAAAAPPPAAAPAAPSRPALFRDPQTGQVFRIENGQRVPVGVPQRPQAPRPPAAQGIPPQEPTQIIAP